MEHTPLSSPDTTLTTGQKTMKFMSNNKYALIGIMLFVGLLCYLVYRMYTVHVKSNLKYESPEQGGNSNIVEVLYFYTNWCPHCKNAKVEWDQFKNIYQGKTIKNMKINCLEINCGRR